jgi:hypothetical protein
MPTSDVPTQPGWNWRSPSPDLSSGLMAGAEGRLAPFVAAILASGYDNGPAAGPGAGVPQAPGVLLPGSQ